MRPIQVTCPGCRDPKKLVEQGSDFFPFCSRECRSTDLSGWANESYRIPGEKLSEEELERFEDS